MPSQKLERIAAMPSRDMNPPNSAIFETNNCRPLFAGAHRNRVEPTLGRDPLPPRRAQQIARGSERSCFLAYSFNILSLNCSPMIAFKLEYTVVPFGAGYSAINDWEPCLPFFASNKRMLFNSIASGILLNAFCPFAGWTDDAAVATAALAAIDSASKDASEES